MNLKSILDLDLRRILNPKVWLIIVLIPHTLFGALVVFCISSIISNPGEDRPGARSHPCCTASDVELQRQRLPRSARDQLR